MLVRRVSSFDARTMAELLNEIIVQGGTTAMSKALSRSEMSDWIDSNKAQSAWHLAESDEEKNGGELLGFQKIGPYEGLPQQACSIATFAKLGKTQLGIGSALFKATREAAVTLGYHWINATIRNYNEGGIAYYQSRGFEPYKRDDVSVFMRYNLR